MSFKPSRFGDRRPAQFSGRRGRFRLSCAALASATAELTAQLPNQHTAGCNLQHFYEQLQRFSPLGAVVYSQNHEQQLRGP